jgi:hypothetical protein
LILLALNETDPGSGVAGTRIEQRHSTPDGVPKGKSLEMTEITILPMTVRKFETSLFSGHIKIRTAFASFAHALLAACASMRQTEEVEVLGFVFPCLFTRSV